MMRRALHALKRDLAAPLGQQAERAREGERAEARNRRALRARVALCAVVRQAFPALTPEAGPCLRLGIEAAAALAAIPDTEELRAADEALGAAEPHRAETNQRLRAKLKDMYERIDEYPIDPAQASLMEMYVLARRRLGIGP